MTDLLVSINPANDKHCGPLCPMQMTARFGTRFFCRLFSESIGGRYGAGVLKIDKDNGVQRHPECIAAEEHGKAEALKRCAQKNLIEAAKEFKEDWEQAGIDWPMDCARETERAKAAGILFDLLLYYGGESWAK